MKGGWKGGGGVGGWMREESANGNLQKSDRARKVARRDFRVRAPKKLVCMCIFTLFYKGGERGLVVGGGCK